MPAIHTVHSAFLRWDQRDAIRDLLTTAFDDRFDADDWEHTLGGLHTLVYDGVGLAAHGALVQRRLVSRDRPLRTGYVEGLAVRADVRRRGYASLVMTDLERAIGDGYDLGALSDGSGVPGMYERRGWVRWRGPTAVLAPTGTTPTPEDDGGVLVWSTANTGELDLGGELACDWRLGDVW